MEAKFKGRLVVTILGCVFSVSLFAERSFQVDKPYTLKSLPQHGIFWKYTINGTFGVSLDKKEQVYFIPDRLLPNNPEKPYALGTVLFNTPKGWKTQAYSFVELQHLDNVSNFPKSYWNVGFFGLHRGQVHSLKGGGYFVVERVDAIGTVLGIKIDRAGVYHPFSQTSIANLGEAISGRKAQEIRGLGSKKERSKYEGEVFTLTPHFNPIDDVPPQWSYEGKVKVVGNVFGSGKLVSSEKDYLYVDKAFLGAKPPFVTGTLVRGKSPHGHEYNNVKFELKYLGPKLSNPKIREKILDSFSTEEPTKFDARTRGTKRKARSQQHRAN